MNQKAIKKGALALGLVAVIGGGAWAYKAFSGNCCGFCPLPSAADQAAK